MRLELTRRGAYAIRAVLTLSRAEREGVVPARRIALEMHIPERFLPQVLADLSRAGIVEARLGRAGGYRLARPAGSISLLDIIEATEGDTRRQSCVLTSQPCGESSATCEVHHLFCAAQEAILERLGSATIGDVLTGVHGSTSDAPAAARSARGSRGRAEPISMSAAPPSPARSV